MYPLGRLSSATLSFLNKVGGGSYTYISHSHVGSSRVFASHKYAHSLKAVKNAQLTHKSINCLTPSTLSAAPPRFRSLCCCVGGDPMGPESHPSQDDRISRIASTIRVIPDFPKPGVMFQDITTMLLDPKAFKDTIDLFVERYKGKDISVVAGVEARGFIFGPPIALAIGAKFVPMRKPGKLPGEVISEEYSLEYGTDKMEMHVGAVEAGERAIVIDDLIATGGTLCAAIKLLERVGVQVVECACLIELPELKGRERLCDNPLFVLIKSA
uniref:adenine phosphoribosyltransferase n=1 Tax=Sesuvium portulacastrum TaxID=221166 RepID=A0A1L5JKC8_SESPO|nr:adenosine phosphoribosyl transferase [Sesuvium portulacastrum]